MGRGLKTAAALAIAAAALCGGTAMAHQHGHGGTGHAGTGHAGHGAQKAGEWRVLFDGKSFAGWRNFKAEGVRPQWVIEDGALHLTGGGGGDIVTAESFDGPFELELEWKISPGGNSGVMYFVRELASTNAPYWTGPEMQVLDDDRHSDGKIPSHRAGALYDLQVPPAGATRPVGEWNKARVVFTGARIEHWLNGVKVADAPYGDAEWKALVAKSKFATWSDFGSEPRGRIALQDHGDKVWYRNIRIRSRP